MKNKDNGLWSISPMNQMLEELLNRDWWSIFGKALPLNVVYPDKPSSNILATPSIQHFSHLISGSLHLELGKREESRKVM